MNFWKLVFLLVFGLGMAAASEPAHAKGLESSGQLFLTFGRTFGEYKLSEDVSGGVYAHGSLMLPIRNTPLLFGYIGPEWSVGKANIKLLTGAFMTGDGGLSAVAGIWYNQGLPEGLNLFVDFEAYFPVDGAGYGHEFRQYYSYLNFSWTADEESGLGVGIAQENFFSEADVFEAAIGPVLKISRGSFWIAYDFTPNVKGDHVLILRLSLFL